MPHMSDTDSTYTMNPGAARPTALGDLRFAGTIAAGLVAGTLGLGALATPLVGWKDWPSALTQQATEGLRYESRGGRLTVEVFRGTQLYASYAQDRTNRDDALTGRVAVGGHAGNVLRSGFDVSASDSRINRPTGAYHSRYVSVGRNIGRALYVSGDYSTSLSVIQFLRSDGIIIETRPWTRRFSGSANATLGRSTSLLFTLDYTQDEAQDEVRILSGLSYRFR